jgi:hypothetical protein
LLQFVERPPKILEHLAIHTPTAPSGVMTAMRPGIVSDDEAITLLAHITHSRPSVSR